VIKVLFIVLTLAVGMHHTGPLLGLGPADHHAATGTAQSDDGDNHLLDGLAAACLAVLALTLAIPRVRRMFTSLAFVSLTPQPMWTHWRIAARGPPFRGSHPPFLVLCSLRR
jgi:hypothetical protein